jgi:tyrosine-protein kinase Etk/Wzc
MKNANHHASREEFVEVEAPEFDVQEYLRRYLRYWYLFPIFLGLTVVGAYFYLQITQPVYTTAATLLIKDEKKGTGMAGGAEILEELAQFSGSKLVENEIEVLSSLTLLAQVVENLGLGVSYDARDGLHTVDLYKGTGVVVQPKLVTEYAYENPLYIHLEDDGRFRLNDESILREFGKTFRNDWGEFTVQRTDTIPDLGYRDIRVHFHDLPTIAESIQERLTVQQPNVKSTVLELSFEDTSPRRGRDVLNGLLDVYVQSNLDDKNREASNTLKFIQDRLGLLTGELGDVEGEVAAYKSSQGLTDISSEAQIFLENIQANDSKLNEVNTQMKVLESVDSFINENGSNAAPATYLINDPVLVSLITRLTDLQIQQERYARVTTASNPLLETVNTQIASTRQAIRENIQNLRRGLTATKQNLESINTRFSAGLRTIPQKEREYVGIKRQQTIKENLYLYLLQKREETALAYASTVTDSRLVDAPKTSIRPVKPKKAIIMLGAGMAGLVIPLLLINLLFLLNNTVQGRDEVENATGTAILGEVGLMRADTGKGEDTIIRMTSRTAVAEQFRALRTNLQYLGDGTCRVLLFTSSIGGEGKSFVTINLGASLAYFDKKVIVVGLDLRKPALHTRLGIDNDRGATNYFIGQAGLSSLIQTTAVHPNLDVLVSGPLPPNPSELLGNGRLPQLISELKKRYDYVLLDAPPFGLVTDAALIADYADATLYVVRHNYTLRDHLRRIADLQRSRRFGNLSIIFNGVNYGAGYGYGYGYGGYGYGYYADEKESKIRTVGERMKRLVGKA